MSRGWDTSEAHWQRCPRIDMNGNVLFFLKGAVVNCAVHVGISDPSTKDFHKFYVIHAMHILTINTLTNICT
jgi:hypothetical protein